MNKKIFLILFLFFSSLNIFSQQLNIDETISYIKDQIDHYHSDNSIFGKLTGFELNISPEGFVKIKTRYYKKDYDYSYSPYNPNISFQMGFYYYDVIPEIDNNQIIFDCKHGDCIQLDLGTVFSSSKLEIDISIERIQQVRNAFEYLFDILAFDDKYNIKDTDPFSAKNYKNQIHSDSVSIQAIDLGYEGNVSTVKAIIGGIVITMVLDSGASDVTISTNLENELIQKGIITKKNYLEPSLYKLADGRIVESRRLTIPSLKIGDFEVKDLKCCVSPSDDVILLGKSFLNMFSKWTLDNKKHKLILEK